MDPREIARFITEDPDVAAAPETYAVAYLQWEGSTYSKDMLSDDINLCLNFVRSNGRGPINMSAFDVGVLFYTLSDRDMLADVRNGRMSIARDNEEEDYYVEEDLSDMWEEMDAPDRVMARDASIEQVMSYMSQLGWL